MIKVKLDIYAKGCLKYLKVTGHAGNKKEGNDLVCAAVSCLVRTTANVLYKLAEISINSQAQEPGILEITINSLPDKYYEWVKGVTEFLITGIFDIKNEFPESIEIIFLNNGDWRKQYGS